MIFGGDARSSDQGKSDSWALFETKLYGRAYSKHERMPAPEGIATQCCYIISRSHYLDSECV